MRGILLFGLVGLSALLLAAAPRGARIPVYCDAGVCANTVSCTSPGVGTDVLDLYQVTAYEISACPPSGARFSGNGVIRTLQYDGQRGRCLDNPAEQKTIEVTDGGCQLWDTVDTSAATFQGDKLLLKVDGVGIYGADAGIVDLRVNACLRGSKCAGSSR